MKDTREQGNKWPPYTPCLWMGTQDCQMSVLSAWSRVKQCHSSLCELLCSHYKQAISSESRRPGGPVLSWKREMWRRADMPQTEDFYKLAVIMVLVKYTNTSIDLNKEPEIHTQSVDFWQRKDNRKSKLLPTSFFFLDARDKHLY